MFDLSVASVLLIAASGLGGTIATLVWTAAMSLVVALTRHQQRCQPDVLRIRRGPKNTMSAPTLA